MSPLADNLHHDQVILLLCPDAVLQLHQHHLEEVILESSERIFYSERRNLFSQLPEENLTFKMFQDFSEFPKAAQ